MHSEQEQHRVILDTDIGTDVDDILALAVLLGSPEVHLERVTTVYGDVALRARMVAKLLQLRGVPSIPVHEGLRTPLLNLDPIYWPGHEGVGLLGEDDQLVLSSTVPAVDVLIQHVLANPGDITLLAVGPLTNVANAILREPTFAKKLKRLVIMGGRISTSESAEYVAEHNISCDPESAHVVFSSGGSIELVPLDVTLRASIRTSGVTTLQGRKTPYHDALADQILRYPPFRERGDSTFLHDPLAALAIVRPDLFSWVPYRVAVELHGRITRGMTVATNPGAGNDAAVSVAMDLDVDGCEAVIIERMAK